MRLQQLESNQCGIETRDPKRTRMSTRLKFKETKNGQGVVCDACPLPYAYIEFGKLVILSRHDSRTHTNTLTAEDLRKMADILDALNNQSCVKINAAA